MFSPKEQFIIYPIISFNFTISNVIFSLLIAGILTISLNSLRSNYIITNNWGLLNESSMRTILLMLEETTGNKK
jgi:hypothetical protein